MTKVAVPGPFPSKMMARKLGTVRDNIVEMVPRRRIGELADMAGVAIYLSSEASSDAIGNFLHVDGSLTGAMWVNSESRQDESSTS